MNIKQLAVTMMMAAGLVLSVSSTAAAQGLLLAETWVSGTVTDGSGSPVSGGSVFVQCNGAVRNVGILGNGTYATSFPQTECKAGDTITASASTGEGSGSNAETVQNTTVNGPVVDLDIAVVDITVPEFGTVVGMMTGVGAIGGFLLMRQKGLV
jgi:hypothetical protein